MQGCCFLGLIGHPPTPVAVLSSDHSGEGQGWETREKAGTAVQVKESRSWKLPVWLRRPLWCK